MDKKAQAFLWVRGGPEHGNTIGLSQGVTMIGRAPNNDIVIDEPGVSRQHTRIGGDRSGYWIQDLSSQNGTFVNEEQVAADGRKLNDGDRVELGGASTIHWIFREVQPTVDVPRPGQ